ncbi:MAG: hypothetical protein Q7P63_00130 [Verrucomicrobiota bacterium JB022]|nr:hypothetical protein [Verrucomicrobiota bacterium JB022]
MDQEDSLNWKHVYQPGRDDKAPELEPLRARLTRDPELQAEVEAEQAFDDAIGQALRSSPVPAGLADSILAQLEAREKPAAAPANAYPPRTPFWWIHPVLLGAAAAVVMFFALGYTFFFPPNQGREQLPPDVYALLAAAEEYSEPGDTRVIDNNYERLVSFLQAHHSPTPAALPGELDKKSSVACESFKIKGVGTGLVCFKKDEDLYHLFTMNRADMPWLEDLPQPRLAKINDHCCVIWTTPDQVYIMTTKAPEKNVRKILSI